MTPGEQRARMVDEYHASGLTMAGFARREGIKYATFAGWVAKAQRVAPAKGPIRFAEVRLPRAATNVPAGGALEVRLPDGTVVRGERVAGVAALVRAVRD